MGVLSVNMKEQGTDMYQLPHSPDVEQTVLCGILTVYSLSKKCLQF